MTQKFLVGEKAKVVIEGEITEVYKGWDDVNKVDIMRYKITSPAGVAISVPETAIEKS